VAYWMHRDQRAHDNYTLLHAQNLALELKQPLVVLFCLAPSFLGATLRQYGFMLRGLEELERELEKYNIPLIMLTGRPEKEIPAFVQKNKISTLVTDFFPLRISHDWQQRVAAKIDVPFFEVDAHNIVPVRAASSKQEYAAYTFRPKINRLLGEFLTPFPKLKKHPVSGKERKPKTKWPDIFRSLKVDHSVPEISWLKPGEKAALQVMKGFFDKRLAGYHEGRNNPALESQSGLSPYFHFGQLAPQRVALEAQRYDGVIKSQESFLEELIVRRELADNFCFYNDRYDAFEGFPDWAKKTLDEHRGDPREYVYTLEQLESSETHDELWNAAQTQMVKSGKMHGYMRMYWAKKILEWSSAPEQALQMAVYLNDRYELDGRDPNGYTGIAWSIGGVHDRPWFEREIFGKIRNMSEAGCRRKFPVDDYIKKVSNLEG
jgi:deoxyribodipyrimidine photo-lyase